MPNYKSYPTVKTTPNRMTRKRARETIFWYNKFLRNEIRRAKKIARKKAKTEKESAEQS